MKKVGILILSLMILLAFSCETEIENYKIEQQSNAIVVYGEINNLTGPYTVRINHVSVYSPYDINHFVGKPVTNAKVRIVDNLGNLFILNDLGNGLYKTPIFFKGNEGQSYQLLITTLDGIEISSTVEKIKPQPELNEFNFKFVDAEKVDDMHFDIKASIKDPKDVDDYYVVKKQDFIQFRTTCPPPPPSPAPSPHCYFKCWRAPLNTQPILINDFLLDGKNLLLPMSSVDLHDWTDWIIQLEVLSISKEIYSFWKKQEEQRNIGGGLFDKVPAQIIGNLKCTNNSTQQVLGAFVASSSLKQRLSIKRYNEISEQNYLKVEAFAEFNNIRFKDLEMLDCSKAAWIDYNLGFNIPEL